MKHTKREWMPLYSFLDRKRVTDHLADMAARGWMLDRLGTWSWHYRRTEPKQLRFAVTFFAGAGRFSPAPAAGLDTFQDYCAQAGWHRAGQLRPGTSVLQRGSGGRSHRHRPGGGAGEHPTEHWKAHDTQLPGAAAPLSAGSGVSMLPDLDGSRGHPGQSHCPTGGHSLPAAAGADAGKPAALPPLAVAGPRPPSRRGCPCQTLRSARGLGILVLMWSGLLIAGLFASISRVHRGWSY